MHNSAHAIQLCCQVINSQRRLAHADGGLAEPKHISQEAVEAYVGGIEGWQDLFTAAGFDFVAATKEEPASVAYPEHDDSGVQERAMCHLEAILGLPKSCLRALATLSKQPDAAPPLLTAVSS